MGQKVVAVALKIVADKIAVVTVGNEADALGEKWVFDFNLFQTDRSGLARDFGQTSQFIDQVRAGSCAAM